MTRACFSVFAICIALLLQTNLAAAEPYKSWIQLTPMQQEALKPLAGQWDSLPTKLQKNLLITTNHYPKLTLDQKRRFQSRLEKWSKLTPEQRERAREKFQSISKAPPEKREQLKRMLRERKASKTSTTDSYLIGQEYRKNDESATTPLAGALQR
jgi:hypothetical protein